MPCSSPCCCCSGADRPSFRRRIPNRLRPTGVPPCIGRFWPEARSLFSSPCWPGGRFGRSMATPSPEEENSTSASARTQPPPPKSPEPISPIPNSFPTESRKQHRQEQRSCFDQCDCCKYCDFEVSCRQRIL